MHMYVGKNEGKNMRMTKIHYFIFFLVSSLLFSKATSENDDNSEEEGGCILDDRLRSLICRETDLRNARSALGEVSRSIVSLRVEFGDIRVLAEPILPASVTASDSITAPLRNVAVVNTGLEALSGDAFEGLETVLERLDLSGNRLTHFPTAVLNLTRLASLDLSDNRIKRLPPGSAFNNLNALVNLNLGLNRLGQTQSENHRGQQINLLGFNLEPLTDTLQELNLRENGFVGLPEQLERRRFPRLIKLDLSSNPIGELPRNAFSGMEKLEYLNLENADLTNLALDFSLPRSLKKLRMAGNPLRCDCQTRWLWEEARNDEGKFDLPRCATPFSVKNVQLTTLKESELCDLLPGAARVPRFFRISNQDKASFPRLTLDSLKLDSVRPSITRTNVSWSVAVDFYYSDYDWAVIFREIGDESDDGGGGDMFYKTANDLSGHIESNPDWRPANETFSASLEGLKKDTYYEVCLTAVDRGTTYYILRENCREIRTQKAGASLNANNKKVATDEVTFVPSTDSVTIAWKVRLLDDLEDVSVIRRISVRKFGSRNETKLYVLEELNRTSASEHDGSRYYTVSDLSPGAPYKVCFDTLGDDESGSRSEKSFPGDEKEKEEEKRPPDEGTNEICGEIVTLTTSAAITKTGEENEKEFPVGEVAAATAVSTSATVFVVALVCCCCFPGYCGKRGKKVRIDDNDDGHNNEKKQKNKKRVFVDVNENKVDHPGNDDVDVEGGEADERQQRRVNNVESFNEQSAFRAEEEEEKFNRSSIVHRSTSQIDLREQREEAEEEEDSILHERFSTATLPMTSKAQKRQQKKITSNWRQQPPPSLSSPGSQAASAPPTTIQVPLPSVNSSSLYSQYDFTIHSEADPEALAEVEEPEEDHHEEEEVHFERKPPKKLSSMLKTAVVPEPSFVYESPHHHPLASLGPGNYHTISSSQYQFYKRPHFMHYYAPPPQPEYYPPAMLQVAPQHHPHPQSGFFHASMTSFSGVDYARTLGRRRRESPMATMPQPPPQVNSIELKPLSMKRLKKSARSASTVGTPVAPTATNKMYTWSPYAMTPAEMSFPANHRMGESFALRTGKQQHPELRF